MKFVTISEYVYAMNNGHDPFEKIYKTVRYQCNNCNKKYVLREINGITQCPSCNYEMEASK